MRSLVGNAADRGTSISLQVRSVARASRRLARRLVVVLAHTRRGMLEQAAPCAFGAVDITRGDAIGDAPPVGGRVRAGRAR